MRKGYKLEPKLKRINMRPEQMIPVVMEKRGPFISTTIPAKIFPNAKKRANDEDNIPSEDLSSISFPPSFISGEIDAS